MLSQSVATTRPATASADALILRPLMLIDSMFAASWP